MIRRGLQFLAASVLLGAAPSLAQTVPQSITLSGFPTVGGTSLNGFYTVYASSGTNYVIARYGLAGGVNTRLDVNFASTNSLGEPQANASVYIGTTRVAYQPSFRFDIGDAVFGWQSTTNFDNGNNAGDIIPGGLYWHNTGDPYEAAFPDWESAAVKIPLGFSLAMAFWAVCVAASIGMKWVRELASAAS